MCVAVTASNILVQYPFHYFGLEHILTYGAFIYPFAFLVNDVTNRRFGSQMARRVVYTGFITGLLVSWYLASPRLAIASGTAFLCAQLLDIAVFSPLRRKSWWQAPLAAAICGSCLDTILFFSIAFAPVFSFIDKFAHSGNGSISGQTQLFSFTMPIWFSLALGDFWVKLAMAFAMLLPYRAALAWLMPGLYGLHKAQN
ncbi:MAG: VUT family protein [Candidatus Tokpelaia sp.]|nr:MAG: VUT family protein [Candidatus Tokpelaia sp.]KAA6205548.1 MAG: VUT family protein [Candidatus Tokpelaia sp.]